LNGVSDGEYEISAIGGGGPNNEVVGSSARKIAVRGADVTGLDLALAAMGSVDAQVNIETDAKLNCGRRRDTAMRETMLSCGARDRKKNPAQRKTRLRTRPGFLYLLQFVRGCANEKGEVHYRNLSAATYRFDVHLPAAGWYLRDVALDQKPGAKTESTFPVTEYP